jgi:RNA polymerase sigma-70 factor (ECF subfamily)
MSPIETVLVNDLLSKVANGDRSAFRALYAKAGPKLYAICLRMMRTRDQADDVYQEAFVKVWERSWQFDPAKGEGLAWLVTLTRHCALDRLRRVPRNHVTIDDVVTHEIDVAAASALPAGLAETQGLRRCLEGLRDDYRNAVILAYMNGLTHEELAERLEKPLGTVKSWVKRGLEQLKDCMQS